MKGLTIKNIKVIIALCCLLVMAPALMAEATATLNLKDADIRTLIKTVSEITGRNFVIDPRVKAKVTIVSSKPMEKEELYQVFLSILQVHGFAAVPTGNVIKIVPDVAAKQGPVPTASPGTPGEGDELVTRVVTVRHVPASQLVPILRPLVPQQGLLAAYAPSNTLIITDRASNINRLMSIIQRVDRADSDEIEIITLRHASAAEVVRIINSLEKKGTAANAPATSSYSLSADDRTNSILIAGDRSSRLKIRGLIAHLDTPLEIGGRTQVVFLKNAKATDLEVILTGVAEEEQKAKGGKSGAAGAATTQEQVSIQADEASNALVITASPAIQRSLRSVIRQLDIRREQILVEAIIAEVGLQLSAELGVQFIAAGADSSGNAELPGALTNFGGAGNSIPSLIANPQSVGAGLSLAVGNLSGSMQFGVLLRALQGDAAANILSTPTLVTMDNEEAEIVVGQNLPFVTGQYTSTGSGEGVTNPFQTIERNDVGIKLKIKPQINEGNSIKMVIEQEASSVLPASVDAQATILSTRRINTTVLAEDSQIIVLGGLIEDTYTDQVQKVPFLGDLPLLGGLFRYTSTSKTKQNLMVFIHPVILEDRVTADAYTSRKYSYVKASQMEGNFLNRGLVDVKAKKLPDLDDLITVIPGKQKTEDETETEATDSSREEESTSISTEDDQP
jgi:general secretion pathway protein D